MTIYELERIDFDLLENHPKNAISTQRLGTFSSRSKLEEYLRPIQVNPYVGWDDRIYPQFKIIKREVI